MIASVLSRANNRVAAWTYSLLALSFIPTLIGVAVGPTAGSVLATIILFGMALGLMFAAMYVSQKHPLTGCALFLAFAFVEGASLTPIITQYMATSGGSAAVLKAFLTTFIVFTGLSLWTWIKGYDAKAMGPYLFAMLLGLLAIMILSIFFPTAFSQTLIAYAGVALFSMFIVYDTSNVLHGRELNPVTAAISQYLNVLNLFLFLLQLFGGKK